MTTEIKKRPNVLFIDNYDSFVFNLVDEFEKRGCAVDVWRNDVGAKKAIDLVLGMPRPRLVVLSPGPGTPSEAGCCLELIRTAPASLPIFGVCLGHQAIVEACGGTVDRADRIVHGKSSPVHHVGNGIFSGMAQPMSVARYHSLVADNIPVEIEVTAHLDGVAMAVAHRSRPLSGVQFHPESILTPQGGTLLENVIDWATEVSNA